jgi:hypothetical protein
MNSVQRRSKVCIWSPIKFLVFALITPCTLLYLTACDSSKENSTSSENSISVADYAQVCNGSGVSGSIAYSKSPGVHPVIIMTRKDVQSPFYSQIPSDGFPKNWRADSNIKAKDNQLVVCMTPTKRELKEKCDFPGDKPSDMKHILEMYNTTYEAILYESKTGKKVASKNLIAKVDECPRFHMFKKTEVVDKMDGNYDQALINFVKPHVQF